MAQGICEKLCSEKGLDITAQSAGICTLRGFPAAENAVLACREIGVDISSFRTTSTQDLSLDDYDRIFVMTNDHRLMLSDKLSDSGKITVLAEKSGGICDPYGGDLDAYRKCRDRLYKEIENSLKEL